MAKYSDIKGFTVQTLSTDPIESTPPTGSWSSGGTMNDGKPYGFKGGGVQTAAISFGAATSNDTANENYNGTSWTENSAMSDGFSYGTGTGSQTDAIAIGGVVNPGLNMKNQTEEWNGSSWTAGGNINTARYNVANQAWGPGTASAFVGGRGPDYQPKAFHEQYNGSSWTETTDMPTDIFDGSAGGTQTNAILASGNHTKQPPGSSTSDGKTITWNGSAWTEVTEFSTARTVSSGSGIYNDFLLIGGYTPSPGNLALTEKWNGSSWTEIADISTARNSMGVSKTESDSTSAIVFGGSPSPTITEEFSVAPPTASIITEGQLFYNSTTNVFKETIQDVPGAAWASTTASNTPRFGLGGAGTQTEALIFSGAGGSPTANRPQTEHWNGSSWTELNDLNLGRYHSAKTSFGTVYTAALAATGYTYASPAQNIANVESWDGTSWTEVNDVNSARRGAGAGGTSTSGIIGGGYTTTITNLAETWNGSSWTEVSELNSGREDTGGVGTSNSVMQMHGGYLGPPGYTGATEQWNGSSWTEVNDMNTARAGAAGSGTPSLAIAVGGESDPGTTAKTEFWDGSSWTEVGDLGTARTKSGSSATSALASILVAGSAPPFSAAAEEFTVNLANKTITSS